MATTVSLRWVIDIVTAAVWASRAASFSSRGTRWVTRAEPPQRHCARPRQSGDGIVAAGWHGSAATSSISLVRALRQAGGRHCLHGSGFAVGGRDAVFGRAGHSVPRLFLRFAAASTCGLSPLPARCPSSAVDSKSSSPATSRRVALPLLGVSVASGIVLAGVLAWALTNALKKTGIGPFRLGTRSA